MFSRIPTAASVGTNEEPPYDMNGKGMPLDNTKASTTLMFNSACAMTPKTITKQSRENTTLCRHTKTRPAAEKHSATEQARTRKQFKNKKTPTITAFPSPVFLTPTPTKPPSKTNHEKKVSKKKPPPPPRLSRKY